MVRLLAIGLSLAAGLAMLCGWLWGRQAALVAGGFGLVATLIQVVALRLMCGPKEMPTSRFFARWAVGTGLRFAGAILMGVLALVNATLFPPLPAALGFLGVLIPLLAFEIRLVH
jgi:hypothetical protein